MPDTPPKPASVKPPKAASTKPPKQDSPPPREPSKETRGRPPILQKQLEEMFLALGMGASVIGDPFDGEVIAENAHELAEAWHKLAQQNSAVKKALEAMMQTGAWSGVLMTTAAVAIPILQNHGAIPPGVPHPFKKPPHIAAAPMFTHAGDPINGNVPPQQGSPVTPSASRTPPEPPPGQRRRG
jgi:hypothetical protein